jgi:deazaflavin-dependent oxidoreductase (nitroreductase family)
VRWLLGLHIRLYRLTGGFIGHWLGPARILLLTTTGRKSGIAHTIPITYFKDGDDFFVVGSNYGKEYPPAWYLNLIANPRVEIQVKQRRLHATATTASPEVRARLWQRLETEGPQFHRYQAGVSREIPLVLLHPVAEIH